MKTLLKSFIISSFLISFCLQAQPHNSMGQTLSNRRDISKNLSFTRHAIERMQERHITNKQIQDLVLTGGVYHGDRPNKYKFTDRDTGISVVLAINGNSGRVITAIRDSFSPKKKQTRLQTKLYTSVNNPKKAKHLNRERVKKVRDLARQRARDRKQNRNQFRLIPKSKK